MHDVPWYNVVSIALVSGSSAGTCPTRERNYTARNMDF